MAHSIVPTAMGDPNREKLSETRFSCAFLCTYAALLIKAELWAREHAHARHLKDVLMQEYTEGDRQQRISVTAFPQTPRDGLRGKPQEGLISLMDRPRSMTRQAL
jgi:hypothetical protein